MIRSGALNSGPARFNRYLLGRRLRRVIFYAALVLFTLLFLSPMVWMISASLKPEGYVFEYPPRLWVPGAVEFENYAVAWSQFPFWRALGNTLTIMVLNMVGGITTAVLTAYVFARLRFPGRNVLFLLVLSTMMIPSQVTLIPQYILFRELGWLDSFLPLTVPAFFGGGAFAIFLLRQFFMSIPRDYDDAARIDGCGTFGILWRVIVPLSLPAIGTLAIFSFMGHWNDFFGPLIYLNSQEKYTLAIAIRQWQQVAVMGSGAYRPPLWVHIMAMATILTIPPVLVYFFTQRYFIQGIVISGVKG
jgi:multiple sugar transport system permease protein